MTNYELLSIMDSPVDDHNWVIIKEKSSELTGVAMHCKDDGEVCVFLGKDGEADDRVVTVEEFNNDFIITSVTDHWGKEISIKTVAEQSL